MAFDLVAGLDSHYIPRDAEGRLKPLTWGELLKIAQEMPTDAQVILSSDGEGNSLSPLASVSLDAHAVFTSVADGKVFDRPRLGSFRSVVLWPMD